MCEATRRRLFSKNSDRVQHLGEEGDVLSIKSSKSIPRSASVTSLRRADLDRSVRRQTFNPPDELCRAIQQVAIPRDG